MTQASRDWYLFTFDWGQKSFTVTRLHNGRYKFSKPNGGSYIVPSWKDECYRISGGMVNYR